MEIYGPGVGLERFRRDALHRQSMCASLAEDEPAYAPIAAAAQAAIDAIDAKAGDVRRANDHLVRARAVERARKLRAKGAYDQARRDLAAEAVVLVPILLPTAPNALGKAGTKRAVVLVESALASLRGPDVPEGVRAEHVPVIEREFARLREADLAEDEVAANRSAIRAGVVVFKAARQKEREIQFGMLVNVAGSRAAADEFFLRAYTPRGDDADEDEGADPLSPDAPAAG